MNNLAISYTLVGRHAEAADLREEALALQRSTLAEDSPDLLPSMNNLAASYQASRRYADALRLYDETLALAQRTLAPTHPRVFLVMNNLAWLLSTAEDAKVRDPQRAVGLAKQAARFAPKNADYLSTLGIARYRAGDWKQATADLAKVVGLRRPDDPQNANESFFLAMGCWQLDDKGASREWFRKGIEWMTMDQSSPDELHRFRTEAAAMLGIKDDANPK
jgi:tetratricopeptide (TPR) repeat protein